MNPLDTVTGALAEGIDAALEATVVGSDTWLADVSSPGTTPRRMRWPAGSR
jgi:hypothetical protein